MQLRPDDRVLSGWVEAWNEGMAPQVILEATHEKTLDYIQVDG